METGEYVAIDYSNISKLSFWHMSNPWEVGFQEKLRNTKFTLPSGLHYATCIHMSIINMIHSYICIRSSLSANKCDKTS